MAHHEDGEGRGGKARVEEAAAAAVADSEVARAADSCPICKEPWSCNGGHRICCIPCGHVYGRSCLEKWLDSNQQVNRAKCPQCSKIFTRMDIINLFAPGSLFDGCCRVQEVKSQMVAYIDSTIAQYRSEVAEEEHNKVVERIKSQFAEEKTRLVEELQQEFNQKLKQQLVDIQLGLGQVYQK